MPDGAQLSRRDPQTRVTKAERGTAHLQPQQQCKCPRFNMTLNYVALPIEKHKRFFLMKKTTTWLYKEH